MIVVLVVALLMGTTLAPSASAIREPPEPPSACQDPGCYIHYLFEVLEWAVLTAFDVRDCVLGLPDLDDCG